MWINHIQHRQCYNTHATVTSSNIELEPQTICNSEFLANCNVEVRFNLGLIWPLHMKLCWTLTKINYS